MPPMGSWRFACVLVLTIILGCGGDGRPKLVQATGKVTLDGQPLEGAIVVFQYVAEGQAEYARPSSGVTNAGGEFTLETYGNGDGAPVGKYKVGIIKKEVLNKLPDDFNSEVAVNTNINYKWITPRAAGDPATSNLTAEITSSGLTPEVFALTAVKPAEVEKTGPQLRANDP